MKRVLRWVNFRRLLQFRLRPLMVMVTLSGLLLAPLARVARDYHVEQRALADLTDRPVVYSPTSSWPNGLLVFR